MSQRARTLTLIASEFFRGSTHKSPHNRGTRKANSLKVKQQSSGERVLYEHNPLSRSASGAPIFPSEKEALIV